MNEVLLLLAGAVGGFFVHSATMKVSFKQRTIDNKIKVYDALIAQWVEMRNFVYDHVIGHGTGNYSTQTTQQFDQIYGKSQQYIGEAILVCDDEKLTTDINILNERVYRTDWHSIPLDQANRTMEEIKSDAILLVARMREDIKASTRFEMQDFAHMLSGLRNKKTQT